jgi:branched-chain amino acid aminotransferase
MDYGKYAYFEGKIRPIESAKVSVMTHSFNYGTAIFEGIRGYWNADEEQLYIFKLDQHLDRMFRNFNILRMKPTLSMEEVANVILELVAKNGFQEDVYIRPIAYKSSYVLGPRVHDLDDELTIYIIKLGDYVDTSSGLKVAVCSWRRLSDNALPPRAKICGCYVNSALAATEAKESGFDEAIFLNEDGTVSEGSAMNIFLVQGGKLVTPPVTANILVGVTRNTVIQIAREKLGIDTECRPVGRTELYVADEIFFCGTGAQVAPVTYIDRRAVRDGKPGSVTGKLQKVYFDVVQCRVPEYRSWCTPVYKKS